MSIDPAPAAPPAEAAALLPASEERTALRWFFDGVAGFFSVPSLILMASFVGFAGLARESGVSIAHAACMALTVWALPAMVVLVGGIQAGASLAATMLAVSLSAFRLMPMVMSLVPVLRDERSSRPALYALSHFIAVTSWVFAMSRLPRVPRPMRMPFFAGFAVTLVAACTLVLAVAHAVAGALPPMLSAALTLLTPLYFLISLWGASRLPADRLALVFGAAAWPLFNRIEPSFALIWTGLAGGSAAYLVGRLLRRRRAAGAVEAGR